MKGPFELWLKEGVKLLIIRFEVCKVVVKKVVILESVRLGKVLMHLECTQWPQP